MRPVLSFTDFYNSIWSKVPEVYRDNDVNNGNPLQILVLTLAQNLYYSFYLKIAAMDELFNVDLCPPKYLPFLASIVNWNLIGTDVASWREQLHAAPMLWKIKGTRKSITLAEKLIGYSVFISELWRDYEGDIVPKERVWNAFPDTVTVKPWFRTVAPDIKNLLYNDSFSDLLSPYNEGTIVSNTDYTTELSSTPEYNPTTGEGSNSRLSKASRINVVLKKDLDLDFNTNGVFTDSNLSQAVDLLLQFKPFHVYINDFLVMYDLTDYLLGSDIDSSGGFGNSSSDAIISRESSAINVSLEDDTDEHVKFYNLQEIDVINDVELSEDDPSYIKGSLRIANESFTLSNLEVESNIFYLTSLGFTLSGYSVNRLTDSGTSIWSSSDFILASKSPNFYTNTEFTNAYTNIANGYMVSINATTNTISVAFSGTLNFISSGYAVNNIITLSGFINSENNNSFTISSITSNTITVLASYSLVSETSLDAFVTSTPVWLVSSVDNDITYTSITPTPQYSFYSYPTNLLHSCSLGYLVKEVALQNSSGDVTGISINVAGNGFYDDTLTIESSSSEIVLNSPNNSPVSFVGYLPIYNKITSSGGVSNNTSLYSGNRLSDLLSWTNALLVSDLLVFVSYNNIFYRLFKKLHYNYDTINKKFIINQYAISLLVGDSNPQNLVSGLDFYIIYPKLEPNSVMYNNDSITRNTNIATRKENKKFNRITFLDNSSNETYIETTSYNPVMYFDSSTGTLLEDLQITRKYKSDLTPLFTKGYLLFNDSTGTSNAPVTVNPLSPLDTGLWEVFVTPTENYVGSEQFSFGLWSNFYNTAVQETSYFLPYNSIDTSSSAQIANRSSSRWQSVVSAISTTYPTYFFSSRENISSRTSLWTRGSASTIPIPYKGNNRASIQGYRGDTALFTRTDFMGDYSIAFSSDYQVDNYKYNDVDEIDQTTIYKNGSSSDTLEVVPQTEILEGIFTSSNMLKTQINPQLWNSTVLYISGQCVSYLNTNWQAISPSIGVAPSSPSWNLVGNSKIIYPNVKVSSQSLIPYTPQYEFPFDFSHRASYYLNSSTNCKPSFYANAIRMDINPYIGNLITESFDTLDINISGLITNQDFYTITSENISNTTFILEKQNVFVTWKQINSGAIVSVGSSAPSTFPSIDVLRNGIKLVYGDYWGFSTSPNSVYLTPACLLAINDTIEIVYDSLDLTQLPTYPSYTNLTGELVICSTNNTQHSNDINTISVPFGVSNKAFPLQYTFEHNPIISWYRSDNDIYISSSTDLTKLVLGTAKVALTPVSSMYRDLATPDVMVSKNGIGLVYGQDWKFTSVPSVSNWSYRVVLNQLVTQALQPYDVINIEYTSILGT